MVCKSCSAARLEALESLRFGINSTTDVLDKLMCNCENLQQSFCKDEADDIVKYGWSIQFNHSCDSKCKPFSMPRLRQLPELFGMGLRYALKFYLHKRFIECRKPFIDGLHQVPHKPIYGVPLGGIGCGSIGRGYRGEFCRFALKPGMYEYDVVEANQFLVTICKRGQTVYQQVLNPAKEPQSSSLKCWNWGFCAENATYHGLYPRSVSVYNIPSQHVRLTCRQLSPIIPHNYKDSSLPVALFTWTAENTGDEEITVSITFTWKNGNGTREDRVGKASTEAFLHADVTGVVLKQNIGDMACDYVIAAPLCEDVSVTMRPFWDPISKYTDIKKKGSHTAATLWSELLSAGELASWESLKRLGELNHPACNKGCELAMALCQKMCVGPKGGSSQVNFSLVWYMPHVHFRAAERNYTRRYYRWFHEGSQQLAAYALKQRLEWEAAIDAWQQPILHNDDLPNWYKSALFNELYYVSDSGSVWLDLVQTENNAPEQHDPKSSELQRQLLNSQIKREMGFFGYLEGHEYRMYNTYDVHYYASWALVTLWPKIQLAIQYDIAVATDAQDDTSVYYVHTATTDVRNARNAVPHDLGDPEDEPWVRVNSYVMFPTHDWKDLNPKFVLCVYRDWKITGNEEYLSDMLPVVKAVMKTTQQWDIDNDGLIENGGYSDQTYDAWRMTGPSAYCGGLWLAALRATVEMMQSREEDCSLLLHLLERGTHAFQEKLWLESDGYYRYDIVSDSCMSDQLNGQWYLRASGVNTSSIFPEEQVRRALRKVYDMNVCSSNKTATNLGAVNGMRRDGKKDVSSVQSEEIWVGVSYALAAAMIQEGMTSEAFDTARGMYRTIFERYGLQFQTPEAVLDNCRFRSLGYMRPLSIWAMQHALELRMSSSTTAAATNIAS